MPENVNTSILSHYDPEENDLTDDRQVMIRVDRVSMVFNMASEQLNSLKEYAIKLVRRELFFEGFTALDNVSFEVKKGDVFGIIGTNGSGKSTLLKIIAGVLEPTKGSCKINGNIAPLIELGAGFDTELSARENIYLNGALLGYPKNFIDDHFVEIVEFAEIGKFLDMPLKNYSSGMVARIAFAIATVIVPEILVVDEVLSVGDFMFQKKCEDRITELIDRHGVTVLIVSHSNEQIARLCNKAIWIEKGHTRMTGNSASVCNIYGGLGGRTGNVESEKLVFEALLQTQQLNNSSYLYKRICGENSDSTNAKLALRAWGDTSIDAVAIVCNTTHVNAIMANGIAAAYDAPILTTKPDYLPDAVERILYDSKPHTLFVFDCENCAKCAIDALSNLPWQPEIVVFTSNGNPRELSMQIIEFGVEHDLWNGEAALIDFDDCFEALAAAPYLYAHKCPAIITFGINKDTDASAIVNCLIQSSFKQLFVFGPTASPKVEDTYASLGYSTTRIAGRDTPDTCRMICEFTLGQTKQEGFGEQRELCIASTSLSQWPELLACGGFAAKLNTGLLLEDQTSLDSICACIRFIEDHCENFDTVLAIGNQSGLNDSNCELLSSRLSFSKAKAE